MSPVAAAPHSDADRKSDEALELEESGRFFDAEARYRAILRAEPGHVATLRRFARLLVRRRDWPEAHEVADRFLGSRPDDVGMLLERGSIAAQLGRSPQAVRDFRRAMKLRPDLGMPHYLLGALFSRERDESRAELHLRRAVVLDSGIAGAHNLLGKIQQARHEDAEAERSFRSAIAIDPRLSEPYWRLGDLLRQRGRLWEAESLLEEAVRLDPDSVPARVRLGRVLLFENRIEPARDCFSRALALAPDDVDLHLGLAHADLTAEKSAEAVERLERLAERNSGSSKVHYDLGVALRERGDLARARDAFARALEADPDYTAARTSLAMLAGDEELAAAAAWFQQRLREGSKDVNLHHNRSYCLFLLGRLEEAWEGYEYRWHLWELASRKLELPQPVWDGSDLGDRTLFIWCEQGIGDEVMFAGLFREALRRTACILVECAPRLIPLFRRSFPSIEFHPHGKVSLDEACERRIHRQIPAGSLPRLFRPAPDSFPAHDGYLVPDADARAELRSRYDETKARLVVGISWRGGALLNVTHQRSIELDRWGPVLSLDGARFVSLQYGDVSRDVKGLEGRGRTPLVDATVDPLRDMDRFAAQVAACDLVISVDNSTVHVAGALGIPVWVLLPFNPEWRWRRREARSYWYPSARLFRQTRPSAWGDVIEGVAEELGRILSVEGCGDAVPTEGAPSERLSLGEPA